MATVRRIFAASLILLLAACTNPFQPDDRRGNPPDPERNSDQDKQQGSAPTLPPVHFA